MGREWGDDREGQKGVQRADVAKNLYLVTLGCCLNYPSNFM